MRDELLLKNLTEIWGVAGYESEVRAFIRARVEPYADEMWEDAIGNLIVLKRGKGENRKKIMYAAHMDQIGFMVKNVEDNGLLRICNMGWNWAGSAYNERVMFRNGAVGVVGCYGPIEEAGNKKEKLFVDIGAKDKEDALSMVKIGDCCAYFTPYTHLAGGQLCSKALDDRLGCYQLIESLKENPGDLPNDVYYCFVVQEELGNRGAQVAAQQILPDIGIAVDITPAHDYPNDLTGANKVGAGIGVKICDPSVVADETVVTVMEKLCTEKGIPYQRDVIDRGGTDASAMNVAGAGAKTGGISVVTRYPHSQSSVVDSGDVEAGIDLMNAFSAYNFSLA